MRSEDKKLTKDKEKGDADRILRRYAKTYCHHAYSGGRARGGYTVSYYGHAYYRYNAALTVKMALHEHAHAEGRVGDSYRMAEISDSIRLEDLLEVSRSDT